MNCCGWNCDGLPRTEPQFYAALQVDSKQAFYDKEQLIGGGMEMPSVHVGEHGETQTTPIHLADHRISIGLRNSGCLSSEVYDYKRWIFDRFVRVRPGCNHMSRIARHRLSAMARRCSRQQYRQTLSHSRDKSFKMSGAPGPTRTADPLVRSQMLYPAELRALRLIVSLNRETIMIETEIKIPFEDGPDRARALIERHGYAVIEPRTLESDQLFDRPGSELRIADQLLRLRRSGARSTVTYKGPATRERHKSREEIEFEVSDAPAFELILERLGYLPRFRYEKYRTKFAAPPGIITIDETPIGVFLELEGPADWIDRTAERLGFAPSAYSTASYAALYRDYLRSHEGAPINMVFREGNMPMMLEKDT
jgi:adenylate cyclase, class 2